jgi:hypothetical protein
MVLPRKTEKANMDRAQLLSLIDWDRMDRIDRMQAECYSMHESGMSYDEIARRMGCCMTPDEVKEMEDFFCESRRKKYKLSLVNAQKNRDAVKVALWKSEQDRMMKATRSSRGQFAAKA